MGVLLKPNTLDAPAGVEYPLIPVGQFLQTDGIKNMWLAGYATGVGSSLILPDLVTGVNATPCQPTYGPQLVTEDGFAAMDFANKGGLYINSALDIADAYTWIYVIKQPVDTSGGDGALLGSTDSSGMRIRVQGDTAGVDTGRLYTRHASTDADKLGVAEMAEEGVVSVIMQSWNSTDNIVTWRKNGAASATVALSTAPVNAVTPVLFGSTQALTGGFYGHGFCVMRYDVDLSLREYSAQLGWIEGRLADAYL